MTGTEENALVLGKPNIIVKVYWSKKTTNSHFQY